MQTISSLNDLKTVKAYLKRVGAEPRSLRTAVIREDQGKYWRDIAVIKITKDGEVKAPDEYAPTDHERLNIKEEVSSVKWPELQPLWNFQESELPENLRDNKQRWVFRDLDGRVIMIQTRIDKEDGGKQYVPWTYWSDKEWRTMEPEGLLPLYGAEQLNEYSIVFIHEGPKAAEYCRWMVEGRTKEARQALEQHPWGQDLKHAAHLGWVGGALNPGRTDWSMIKRSGATRAYIVSDNDLPGRLAVPHIAFQLRIPTFHVQFTNDWNNGFDLADPFPDSMFKELEGVKRYVGPSMRACLHPATWATDLVQPEKGRPYPVLRDDFKGMFAYAEEADLYVCIDMPEILRTETVLNKMLSSFSHTRQTTQLINKAYMGRSVNLCYRPDQAGRVVTDGHTSAINLHTPTHVRPAEGDPSPFIEFLSYMFPNDDERKHIEKWLATLIAKPEMRIEHGILLVSEAQGIGKTTLGSAILAPLVGRHNTGWPREADVANREFNDWCAHKRLVIVNEIYSGHSWKAYNNLKTLITDNEIQVNQKYQKQYTIENWVHIIACSNSLRALKVEDDDRRWFYPEVTEMRWPREKFERLHTWLQSGGLNIIMNWAMEYGNYVGRGELPPMTWRKRELIEGSRTEAQQEAADIARALVESDIPMALAMKDVISHLRASAQGKVFETDYEIRKVMKSCGILIWPKRVKVHGRTQHVLFNKALEGELADIDPKEQQKALLQRVAKVHEMIDEEM